MREILNRSAAEAKMHRMAIEVAERNCDSGNLVLIGIKENGVFIAAAIAALLKNCFEGSVTVLTLEIDKRNPENCRLDASMDLKDQNVILIDDVANSGRTMLYALMPIIASKPRQVETLALMERTHKKFPVAVNYVGLSVATTREEHIEVAVDASGVSGAWLK